MCTRMRHMCAACSCVLCGAGRVLLKEGTATLTCIIVCMFYLCVLTMLHTAVCLVDAGSSVAGRATSALFKTAAERPVTCTWYTRLQDPALPCRCRCRCRLLYCIREAERVRREGYGAIDVKLSMHYTLYAYGHAPRLCALWLQSIRHAKL